MHLYILTLRQVSYYYVPGRFELSLGTTFKFFSLILLFFSSFCCIYTGMWILTRKGMSNYYLYMTNSHSFSLYAIIHRQTIVYLPLTQSCIFQLTIIFLFSKRFSTTPIHRLCAYIPYLIANQLMVFGEHQSIRKFNLKYKAHTHKHMSYTT